LAWAELREDVPVELTEDVPASLVQTLGAAAVWKVLSGLLGTAGSYWWEF
jgi:hypothetical protein